MIHDEEEFFDAQSELDEEFEDALEPPSPKRGKRIAEEEIIKLEEKELNTKLFNFEQIIEKLAKTYKNKKSSGKLATGITLGRAKHVLEIAKELKKKGKNLALKELFQEYDFTKLDNIKINTSLKDIDKDLGDYQGLKGYKIYDNFNEEDRSNIKSTISLVVANFLEEQGIPSDSQGYPRLPKTKEEIKSHQHRVAEFINKSGIQQYNQKDLEGLFRDISSAPFVSSFNREVRNLNSNLRNIGQKVRQLGKKIKNTAKSAARKISRIGRGE